MQPQLIPDARPEAVFREIPIEKIDTARLVGRKPTAEFSASIKRFGVIQPIAVVEHDGAYHVAAGRNRVVNAKAAGLTTVPAMVYPESYTLSEVIALIENAQRSDNTEAEIEAVTSLVAKGAMINEIAAVTGLSQATIEKRLRQAADRRLDNLAPELKEAVQKGRMSMSVAQAAQKLPEEAQSELAKRLLEKRVDPKIAPSKKRLTMADVETVKAVYQADQIVSGMALEMDRINRISELITELEGLLEGEEIEALGPALSAFRNQFLLQTA